MTEEFVNRVVEVVRAHLPLLDEDGLAQLRAELASIKKQPSARDAIDALRRPQSLDEEVLYPDETLSDAAEFLEREFGDGAPGGRAA